MTVYILHDTPAPVHISEVGKSTYILAGTVMPAETVAASTAFFTVSGSEVRDKFPTTSVDYNYKPLGAISNISRRTN